MRNEPIIENEIKLIARKLPKNNYWHVLFLDDTNFDTFFISLFFREVKYFANDFQYSQTKILKNNGFCA